MYRIGILGAARIAPPAIIEPARRNARTEVVAVASASGKGGPYAETHSIPKVYGAYAELYDDPEIDIIYNALPGHEHGPQTIAALEAGKHVLCEKPFAMGAGEAREMVAAAERTGRLAMEAFHNRYHPLMLHLLELKSSGRLGTIRHMRSLFRVEIPFREGELRHIWEMGGGALMDLGCYAVHAVRSVAGEEPEVVSATGTRTESGVDETIEAALRFPSGATAEIVTGMAPGTPFEAELTIETDKGRVKVFNFVKPHEGHSIVEELEGPKRELTVAGGTTYDFQLEALIEAIESGTPPVTSGADSIGNMAALDAIYEKAGFALR